MRMRCAGLGHFRFAARIFSTSFVFSLLLLFPALSRAQGAARDAIALFPADTQQIVYTNLAQLRALPEYPKIRPFIFNQQLRDLADFLRAMGTDPEKDVDEVTLAWRGDPTTTSFLGMSEGRLDPNRTHDAVVRRKVPFQQYEGYELYASASGQNRSELYFVFFDSSSAAFGRLQDLKAMINVRAGTRPPLNSVAEFASGETELEGTAPQWGIARGAAAASQAAPWLTGGANLPGDPKTFLSSVQTVLYRFDWGNTFSIHMSMICKNSAGATSLMQIFSFLQAARPAAGGSSSSPLSALFQGLEVHTNDNRVEVSGSVPIEVADQMFRNAGTPASP